MKWYVYFIIIAAAAFAYLIVVDLKSKKAIKAKALERAFETAIPDEIYAQLTAQMEAGHE